MRENEVEKYRLTRTQDRQFVNKNKNKQDENIYNAFISKIKRTLLYRLIRWVRFEIQSNR